MTDPSAERDGSNGASGASLLQPIRWIAVAAWTAAIYLLSAQSSLPEIMHGWPGLQDIAGHFGVYAVLALLWRAALAGAGVRRAGFWALVLALLSGAADELHQAFVPGRHPDLFDVATDAVGAAAALGLAHLIGRAARRERRGED